MVRRARVGGARGWVAGWALLALLATAEAHAWPSGRTAAAVSRALFRNHPAAETKGPPHARAALRRRAAVFALASVVLALPGCGGGERERSGALYAFFLDVLGVPVLQVGPAAKGAAPAPPPATAAANIRAEAVAPPPRLRGAQHRR